MYFMNMGLLLLQMAELTNNDKWCMPVVLNPRPVTNPNAAHHVEHNMYLTNISYNGFVT